MSAKKKVQRWDARPKPAGKSWFVVNRDTGGLICECDYENHALLIAAAPELRDLTASLADSTGHIAMSTVKDVREFGRLMQSREQAAKLIAKLKP